MDGGPAGQNEEVDARDAERARPAPARARTRGRSRRRPRCDREAGSGRGGRRPSRRHRLGGPSSGRRRSRRAAADGAFRASNNVSLMQSQRPSAAVRPERRDAVIVYHAIGRVPRSSRHWNGFIRPERFEAQMAYLAEHRRVVRWASSSTLDASDPGPRVWRSPSTTGTGTSLEHAVPVLADAGFPATFFVPTKWIGSARGWGTVAEDTSLEIMERGGARGARAPRLRDREPRPRAHRLLARRAGRRRETTCGASVERLGEILGHAPRYLAYPYGRATRGRGQRGGAAGAAGGVRARPSAGRLRALRGGARPDRSGGREAALRAQDGRPVQRVAPQRRGTRRLSSRPAPRAQPVAVAIAR